MPASDSPMDACGPDATEDPRGVLQRPGAEPDATLRWGPEPDHLLDVHLPAGAPVGLVVLLHGGFWRQAYDRRHTRPLADALRGLGLVVATAEYRRTGGAGGWPGTLDDVAMLRDRLPGLLADALPGRVPSAAPVVLGHSAGGHLALWWALTGGAAARVVALAPVSDLRRAYVEDLDDGAVLALLGAAPDDAPDRWVVADPAPMLRAGAPVPVTVLHGTRDRQVPYEHSLALDGLPGVTLVTLPGVDHFALIDPMSAVWPEIQAAVEGPSTG